MPRLKPPTTMLLVATLAVAALATGATLPSHAATSSSGVGATVLGSTQIDASGCPSGGGITNFGTLVINSRVVTGSDCTVAFGSSNTTAMLRLQQRDGVGVAMFRLPNGTLASGFDSDGILQVDLSGADRDDGARRVQMQPDGRIVIAGWVNNGTNNDLLVARVLPSGVLDPSFGGGDGIATLDLGGVEEANDLAVQSDGKLVVAGFSSASGNQDVLVARFTTAGALDTTFDTDGWTTTDVLGAGVNDAAQAVTLQSDGKIVVGGRSLALGNGTQDELYARYLGTGALDTTFSGDGIVVRSYVEGVEQPNQVADVAIQADGMIVGFGRRNGSDGGWVRLTAAGAPDADMQVGNAGNEQVFGAIIDSSGKYVHAMDGNPGPDASWLIRTNTNATYDATFGPTANGRAYADAFAAGAERFSDVAETMSGELVAVGYGGIGGSDLLVARSSATGTFEPSFDGDGYWTRNISGASIDQLLGVALGPDGRIIAAGTTTASTDVDTLLTAMDGEPIPDFDDDNAGSDSNWTDGANAFGGCLHTVSGGAGGGGSAGWFVAGSGNCTTASNAEWNGVAAGASQPSAKVASTSVDGTTTAVANLRFGMRTSTTQQPGRYVAHLAFDVLAPNA